jgi:hypothetical protein
VIPCPCVWLCGSQAVRVYSVDSRNVLDRQRKLVERDAGEHTEGLSHILMMVKCESRSSTDSERKSTTRNEIREGSRAWSFLRGWSDHPLDQVQKGWQSEIRERRARARAI